MAKNDSLKWHKVLGVVQPGGIWQYGSHDVFVYPPNSERVAAQSKFLLMRGKQTIGAYPTLSAAKRALPEMLFTPYGANPAPRVGTKRPRRVSQVTKKPPTKRLVTRRKANVKAGYFPNPVNPPLNETEFMVHLYRSKELAMKKAGTVAKRQAAVSYAEGMATGAMLLGLFDRKERDTFMAEIGAAHGVK